MDAEIVANAHKKKVMPRKPVGALAKPSKDAADLSIKYDIPIPEAYQIVTGKLPDHRTVDKISQRVEKWSLHHPASLKAASKTIKAFAAGQSVGGTVDPKTGKLVGEIKPKDSTVLAAATRIVDQTDPVVKRAENLNITAELHPVDLLKYMGK